MIKIFFCLFFLFFIITCRIFQPEEFNHDPLPLVSPEMIDVTSGDDVQTFQLQCGTNPEDCCLYDEDGDTVTVVLDGLTLLPESIVLDNITGILTVTHGNLPFIGSAKFWTIDGQGGSTEMDALTVRFKVP